MELDNKIREFAEAWGADLYGVANLHPAHDAILAQGGPVPAEYPRAISLGIALLDAIVDQLPQRAERAVAANYRHHAYDVVNQRLDEVASRLSGALQRAGYRALPIPASQRVDDERLCATFSHKMAAHLAGLGWIGKSCLLITPRRGPRVRWATILTDAPLRVTGQPMDQQCGDCDECVRICPVNAFTGRAFAENEPREARYAASKCDRYLSKMKETTGLAVCGQCLYICPHGRKTAARSAVEPR